MAIILIILISLKNIEVNHFKHINLIIFNLSFLLKRTFYRNYRSYQAVNDMASPIHKITRRLYEYTILRHYDHLPHLIS